MQVNIEEAKLLKDLIEKASAPIVSPVAETLRNLYKKIDEFIKEELSDKPTSEPSA